MDRKVFESIFIQFGLIWVRKRDITAIIPYEHAPQSRTRIDLVNGDHKIVDMSINKVIERL